MTVHRLFAGHVDLVTARAVREAIARIDPGAGASRDYRGDLSIIVTELIENALQAGAIDVEITMEAGASAFGLRVWDDAPGVPVQGLPAPGDTSGRGLPIIDSLADAWGFHSHGRGKTVWARLDY